MFKNVASQKLIVFAFDSTTNLPKTGDAANLTAYVSKDYGAVTVLADTTATEMDATNAKGYYLFDLAQAETNADTLLFSAKSSTSNIVVIGVPATVFTAPPNFTALALGSNGHVSNVDTLTTYTGNTPQTGDAYAVVTDAAFGNAKLVRSTTPANTLDVSATGEAGLDFNNVKDAAGAHTLANITVPTVTTLANLPAVPANWLTAAGIAAAALNGKGDWPLNTDYTAARAVKLDNLDAAVTSRLAPTVAARTLDVSATGEAGVDWANVGGQGTAVTLSATTVNLVNTATALTNDPAGVSTMLGRLTALRAGYLDNINNATLAAATFPTDPADESLVIAATDAIMGRLGAPAGASVSADIAAVSAKTTNLPATPAATGDAMTLTAGERAATAAAVLAAGDIDGYTLEEAQKLALAALAGKLSGAATAAVAIRAADDSKARITAAVDADGNRSAVTLDAAG